MGKHNRYDLIWKLLVLINGKKKIMHHLKNKIVIATASSKIEGLGIITYLCSHLSPKKFEITLIVVNNQNSTNSFQLNLWKE